MRFIGSGFKFFLAVRLVVKGWPLCCLSSSVHERPRNVPDQATGPKRLIKRLSQTERLKPDGLAVQLVIPIDLMELNDM